MIGMIGLVVLGLFANIAYYEYLFIKRPKKDINILSGYKDLVRIRNGRR